MAEFIIHESFKVTHARPLTISTDRIDGTALRILNSTDAIKVSTEPVVKYPSNKVQKLYCE